VLKISDLRHSYGNNKILRGIDLAVGKGDIVAIAGPSGTGKTTLLRCINYLASPHEGALELAGRMVDFKRPHKDDINYLRKNTAMVFQNYNLFKNKTALENVTEGLTAARKMEKNAARERALKELNKVDMLDKLDSYPAQLSGGQQQRVGIARALALDPKIILFDEPTSALDPEMVNDVLALIKAVAKEGITMIIVTHELLFAREISTKIVFMENGVIVEEGSPRDIFLKPQKERTKKFFSGLIPEDYAI
jgi:L-cystine transport system ATP-binding protein